jgi:hypothetical protein
MKIYKEKKDGRSRGGIYVPFILYASLLIAKKLIVIITGIIVTVDRKTLHSKHKSR